MKKLLFLLIMVVATVSMFGQKYAVVGTTADCPGLYKIGGTSMTGPDTLGKNDTLQWSFRVRAEDVQSLELRVLVTKSTGTISDSIYFYGSMDGVTLDKAIDTLKNTNLSTGYLYPTATAWSTFNYTNLIVRHIAKGGAAKKSARQMEFVCRNE